MGQKNCWKVLGIEPTKDKAAIKSAFAKLAHKVSPEDQPEEYQRIHDAYKQAMMIAKRSAAPAFSGTVTDMISKPAEQQEEKEEDPYDFSIVAGAPEEHYDKSVERLLDCIVEFKERNGITTFADVANRKSQGLTMMAVDLFGMYADLTIMMNDSSVWDSYFEEPSVKSVAYEPGFRKFLRDQIEHHNPPYPEKLDEYCKKVAEEVAKTQEELRRRDEIEKKKERRDMMLIITAVVTLLIITIVEAVIAYYGS